MASEPKYFRPASGRDNTDQLQQPPRTIRPAALAAANHSFIRRPPAERPEPVVEAAGQHSYGGSDGLPKGGHHRCPPAAPDSAAVGNFHSGHNNSCVHASGAAPVHATAASRFIVLSTSVRRKLLDFVDLARFSRRNPC